MQITKLAQAIAQNLPQDWTVETPQYDHLQTIVRRDGLALYVRLTQGRGYCSPNERHGFTKQHPDLHGAGVLRSDDRRPVASFDPNRQGKAIATQVQRVVVKPFEALRPAYLAKMNALDDSRRTLQQAVVECCAIMQTSVYENGRDDGPDRKTIGLGPNHKAYGQFDFSGYSASVNVKLHNLTFDDAKALAQWLATRNKPLGE